MRETGAMIDLRTLTIQGTLKGEGKTCRAEISGIGVPLLCLINLGRVGLTWLDLPTTWVHPTICLPHLQTGLQCLPTTWVYQTTTTMCSSQATTGAEGSPTTTRCLQITTIRCRPTTIIRCPQTTWEGHHHHHHHQTWEHPRHKTCRRTTWAEGSLPHHGLILRNTKITTHQRGTMAVQTVIEVICSAAISLCRQAGML